MMSVRGLRSLEESKENEPVTPVVAPVAEEPEKEGSDEFDALLRSLVSPDSANNVNEEELFAGLVKERLASLKGEEAGAQYSELFAAQKQANTSADGYVACETAAKNALKEMRDSGELTKEEADQIYSQAFAAAQLDGNADALYDSRGGSGDTSIATALIDSALATAKSLIEKFTDGGEEAATRSLDEENAPKPGGGFSVGAGTSAGAGQAVVLPGAGDVSDGSEIALPLSLMPDTIIPQGNVLDGPNGFLFKPISENESRLAVLLSESMAHKVESVVLRDINGNILDEGRSTGYGDTGEREKFSFSRQGGDYPRNLTVEIRMMDGSVKTMSIPDPSQRYD